MITSIVCKEHPYVLEKDRSNPKENQTVFYIMPKTVRGSTETAANYAKTQIEHRKKGTKGIDVKAMWAADDAEWAKAVRRIQNFGITLNCPGPEEGISGYDHFRLKADKDPSKYALDSSTGTIVVVDTTDETDMKYIFWAMSPDDTEEIMRVYFDYSALKEGSKNG